MVEHNIKERGFKLLTVLYRISRIFLRTHDIDGAINKALQIIGKSTMAELSLLYMVNFDDELVESSYVWYDTNSRQYEDHLKYLSLDMIPSWIQKIRNGEIINVGNVSELPPEENLEKELLITHNIKNLLILPVMIEGQLTGFIWLENISLPDIYKDQDISLFILVSDLFSTAILRHRERKRLLEFEKRFRVFTNQPLMGIMIIQDNRIIFTNSVLCRLFGYKNNQIDNKELCNILNHFSEDSRNRFVKTLEKIKSDSGCIVNRSSYSILSKDQGEKQIRTLVYRINMNGSPSVLTFVIDETDKERYRKRLEGEKTLAELYLDILSHDLGNIHQSLAGSLSLMRYYLDDKDRLEKSIDLANKSVNDSLELTKEVILLSRIMNEEPRLELIDLKDIISKSIDTIRRVYNEKEIIFDMDIRVTTVLAEPLLKEVFTNLFHNAVRLQGKKPWIYIESMNDGTNTVIIISDKGPGIPDTMKRELFERFGIQGERTRTGLGLSIVKGLVNRYNGTVNIKDRVKGDHSLGTSFVIKLPNKITS